MVEIHHPTVFDSDQERLGTIYAKALLGATEKAGVSETVLAELDSLVQDVLRPLPKLEAALESPRIPYERKEQLLDRAFGGRMAPLLLNFLKILARRGRFDCLRAIQQASRDAFNEIRGRVVVYVRAAEPLDAAAQTLVTSRLRAMLHRDIDLRVSVDPDVVAGLVIRVGDTVYDGSVANQLARLRDEIIAKTNRRIRQDVQRFTAPG